MKKTDFIVNGRAMVRLDCDEAHVLHRVGSDDYTVARHAVVAAEAVGDWEELTVAQRDAAALEAWRAREYKRRLSAAVHERYDIDDEIALGANANAPALLADEAAAEDFAAEYAAYQAYRAECKARVRAEVAGLTMNDYEASQAGV